MTSECGHCGRKFGTFEKYAQHILTRHPDDAVRVAWAREILPKPVELVIEKPPPYVPPEVPSKDDHDEVDEALRVLLRPEVFERLKK